MRDGVPIKVIARSMGISKNTVRKALRDDGPPRYERSRRGRWSTRSSPGSASCCGSTPTMPATVVAERIGWEHSMPDPADRVSDLRPVYLPPDPASRTTYEPGELAQFDFWFPTIELPVGVRPDSDGEAVAGDDDGERLLAVVGRNLDPFARGRRPLRGLVASAVDPAAGRAEDAGVGRRRSGRAVACRQPELTGGLSGVPRCAGHQGVHLQAGRSRSQGHVGAAPRLPREVIPPRATVRVARRTSTPSSRSSS